MPIGDSITIGVASSDGDGWRLHLDYALHQEGYKTDFVGSHNNGTWSDDQNEGFGGYWIYDILRTVAADRSLSQRPNIVMVMAGTNDIAWGDTSNTKSYADAPARLGNLLDFIICGCPDAVILVSTIIQNVAHQDKADAFNAAIPHLVSQRRARGSHILVVDQSHVPGPMFLHPNDDGYRQMAETYLHAISTIPDGWLGEPSLTLGKPKVDGCTPSYNPWLASGVATSRLRRRDRERIIEEAMRQATPRQ